MPSTAEQAAPEAATPSLIGEAPTSPAGPIERTEQERLPLPPLIPDPRALQVLRFTQRQIQFVFRARRRFGETFRMWGARPEPIVFISHPDHVRSLFVADPEVAPSLTAESPLRPIIGPNSVLTAIGPRHMRQRKLLLPHFHGDAIRRYADAIADAAEAEIDSWPLNRPFALAPRMQAITLDVIMAGIFGIEGRPGPDTPEGRLRAATERFVGLSTKRIARVGELLNLTRAEPVGPVRAARRIIDQPTFELIAARRRADDLGERRDILSLLLTARTEEGEALSDQEVRDELVTLVLAGHETTANSLAWAWERLVRHPEAQERLVESVRAGEGDEEIEATIHETMRSRPVVPIVGRRVLAPWRLGPHAVPADTPILVSILLLHHREDLYPRPFEYLPERWHGRRPGTYEWIPFGGGTRRCLGAALAMAEQRVVLDAMARRLDVAAPEPEPERALHRNVTMIPARGARVVVRSRS